MENQEEVVPGASCLGQPDSFTTLVPKAVTNWRDEEFLKSVSPLHHPIPDLHLFSDASPEGWGSHMGSHMASGLWPPVWKHHHINVLELRTVQLALQEFAPQVQNQAVLLATDNTTVAAYINKQGGGGRIFKHFAIWQ